jgi:hypothetical protein
MQISSALMLVFVLSLPALAQKDPYEDDIRALTAAGKVEKNTYSNPHAGFVLHLPLAACQHKLNTSIDFSHGYAMLLSCVRDKGEGSYTFHIQAETWAHYPELTLEQYVRSLRHLAERDPDMKTIQLETPRKWAGLDFLEVITTLHRSEHLVYVGLTCTHLNAYVMCFRSEADTEQLARALVMLDRKLEITATPALQKPSERSEKVR